MPVGTVLETWRARRDFAKRFTAERVFPLREGEYAPFPPWVPEGLIRVMKQGGISNLYSHQRKAVDRTHDGENVVIVTPTASGKTLCIEVDTDMTAS